ncbi:MAG: hypothetical protein HYY77_03545, partial [Betaproteobacteria bacterium]|nr:hypothetical protein [Betaproteobacteria bacterium]
VAQKRFDYLLFADATGKVLFGKGRNTVLYTEAVLVNGIGSLLAILGVWLLVRRTRRALADSVRAIADAAAPGSRDANAADERAAPAERTDELAPVAQRVFARLSRGERLLERTGLRRQ